MSPRIVSFVVAAIAYGVLLIIANIVLSGMRIGWLWGIVAVALFTVLISIVRPLLTKFLTKHVHEYTWVIGLATVLVSLILTVILSPESGFSIHGFWTWVWATLIVWVGTLIYDVVDDRLVAMAQKQVDSRKSKGSGTTSGAAPA
ncbi:hypothetical protein GCM10025864_25580 [Luteimicrobium album]|uniref:Phage holin family protein n=1 Tax=Luteimicrobium album TaxID=1054550 RepID=A0ABQ6I4Q3_9MICO|nr:phage holin family protein [Luteimicrobium album]GMA24799.1 hypothetical protein GCM10025864_25580 [Luteimicrobium album]